MRFNELFTHQGFSVLLIAGWLLVGTLAGCASSGGTQQSRTRMPSMDPSEMVERIMPRLTEELNLTSEQEEKVREILEVHFTAIQEIREQMAGSSGRSSGRGMGQRGGDQRGMNQQAIEEMEKIQERTESHLAEVLTKEQLEKYNDIMEEISSERRDRMRSRRNR